MILKVSLTASLDPENTDKRARSITSANCQLLLTTVQGSGDEILFLLPESTPLTMQAHPPPSNRKGDLAPGMYQTLARYTW